MNLAVPSRRASNATSNKSAGHAATRDGLIGHAATRDGLIGHGATQGGLLGSWSPDDDGETLWGREGHATLLAELSEDIVFAEPESLTPLPPAKLPAPPIPATRTEAEASLPREPLLEAARVSLGSMTIDPGRVGPGRKAAEGGRGGRWVARCGARQTPLARVWIGPGDALQAYDELRHECGITHVLNLCEPPTGGHWLLLACERQQCLLDGLDARGMLEAFADAHRWIDRALSTRSSNRVLVQCSDGRSRCGPLILYLMMEAARMGPDAAACVLRVFEPRLGLSPSLVALLHAHAASQDSDLASPATGRTASRARDWFLASPRPPGLPESVAPTLAWLKQQVALFPLAPTAGLTAR